jgi:hypothetical protein
MAAQPDAQPSPLRSLPAEAADNGTPSCRSGRHQPEHERCGSDAECRPDQICFNGICL